MNDSLSVKEFAAAANVKPQTIYKQLSGRLEPYVITVKGKKRIKKEALIEYYSEEQPNSTENQPESAENQLKSTERQLENQLDSTQNQLDSTDKKVSQELLEMLKEEIKKKDQQIEKLQESLDKAYMQISDMAQKAQYITAADKTEKIMQQQPDQKEIIEPSTTTTNSQNTENHLKKKWFQFWK